MSSSDFPTDPNAVLVADASVVINLTATGFLERIVAALRNPLVVTGDVRRELARGAEKGHGTGEKLQSLTGSGVVGLADLGEVGKKIFESLVSGEILHALDDGEASVIAHAAEIGGVAMIDEKKAKKICEKSVPRVPTVMTIDLLFNERIRRALGKEGQRDAVYNALRKAHMNVPREIEDRVVGLIGKSRAKDCISLSLKARRE